MINPIELRLKNWATWASVKIPLANQGLTVVRGRNLDELGQQNYVGKSSMFNSIYALVYGQHQLASRKNSIGKIIDKGTLIDFKQQIDNHNIDAVLKDGRLRVSLDNELLQTHKKNDERVELQNLMNVSTEMWSSTIQINGIASNPLLRGSSAQRCNFLEKAFDLDRWAALYGRVGNVISQMQRADNELETVKADLLALNFKKLDVESLKVDLQAYKARLQKVKRIIASTNRILGVLSDMPEKSEHSVEELTVKISTLEKQQLAAQKYETLFETWEVNVAKKQKIKIAIKRLENAMSEVAITGDLDLKIARLQDQIEQHENHTEDCPVCGHVLTRKIDSKILSRVYKAVGNEIPTKEKVDIKDLRQRLNHLQAIKSQIKNNENIKIKLKSLRRDYAEIGDLVRPTGKAFTKQHDDQLKLFRAELFTASRWEKVGKYTKYNRKEMEQRLDKAALLEEKLTDKISKTEATIASYEVNHDTYIRLHKKQKALEEELELRPIYKALKSAYSPNGMRLWLLQELLEALIVGLNENIHSTKDFKTFGYKLSRNRELVLTASNLRSTYDLYMLSGAEGVLFTLNLLTVLLPMLPSNKRCNMLILDDMDAMCSSYVRDIIADVYLARLNPMVKSLFFLTPTKKDEFAIKGANEWLVTKKSGVSTLER